MEVPNVLFLMNVTRMRYLVTAIALMPMTFSLHANPILPGGTVSPDMFNLTGTPPLLGDSSGTFNFGGGVTGSYEDTVLVDPLGVACSGCLDFAYRVSLDASSPDAIFTSNVTAFFGYTTDVGYLTGSGDVAPNSVTRGPFGGFVDFKFNTTTSVLLPGESTDVFVVATNATSYDTNGVLGITGGSAPAQSFSGQIDGLFEPTPVPEPSTALLLSLGLAGIVAFRVQIRSRSES
jgi:hypothetical protein